MSNSRTPNPALDNALDDTFPASDPPSRTAPSTVGTAQANVSETAWIDLFRIESADTRPDDDDAHLPAVTHIGDTGPLCFATSAALALLHHLVETPQPARRVCLVSARVDLAHIDSFAIAPPGVEPGKSVEADPPLDRQQPPAQRPGRFRPSALSPADREVVWDTAHPEAGVMQIVSRTVFDLDPRLRMRGQHDTPAD